MRRLKSRLRRAEDSRWGGSLTMVPAGHRAKRLSSVNHTTQKKFISLPAVNYEQLLNVHANFSLHKKRSNFLSLKQSQLFSWVTGTVLNFRLHFLRIYLFPLFLWNDYRMLTFDLWSKGSKSRINGRLLTVCCF